MNMLLFAREKKWLLLMATGTIVIIGIALWLVVFRGEDPAPKLAANDLALVGDEPITKQEVRRWGRLLKDDPNPKSVNAQLMFWEQLRQYEELGLIELADGDIDRLSSNIQNKVRLDLTSDEEERQARLAEAIGYKLDELGAEKNKAPTQEDLASLYRKNIKIFTTPERRAYQAIATSQRANAVTAARLVRSGADWYKVGQRYSTDLSLRTTGGVRLPTEYSSTDPAIRDNVFAAPKGKIVGPIELGEQYYLIRVNRVLPERIQPFTQARAQLTIGFRQTTNNNFFTSPRFKFFQYWKSRTLCAPGYKIPACKNGPSFFPHRSPQAITRPDPPSPRP